MLLKLILKLCSLFVKVCL